MWGVVFVLGLLGAALVLLTARHVLPTWRQLRFIVGARPTTIGALSEGEVALLEGRAAGVALPSAVAGAPYVLWQVEVEEYRGEGRSGHWTTIGRYVAAPSLLVDDGTGTVAVELRGATLDLRTAFSASTGLLSPLPPHVERTLERLGVPNRAPWGLRRSLRVIERRVEASQPLVVCGTVLGGERPALRAHPNAPSLISDRSITAIRGRLVARLVFVALLLVGLPILTLLALGAGF